MTNNQFLANTLDCGAFMMTSFIVMNIMNSCCGNHSHTVEICAWPSMAHTQSKIACKMGGVRQIDILCPMGCWQVHWRVSQQDCASQWFQILGKAMADGTDRILGGVRVKAHPASHESQSSCQRGARLLLEQLATCSHTLCVHCTV